jgi:2-polyprenyl-6-methoxyphenol hydroxylase-like FAD-dependent oxidoreductase
VASRILVAGAGPAGLVLALQARDHGASVRVIERRRETFRPSRALILHARTLEVLRPLGLTRELLARADTAPAADLHLGSRVIRVALDNLGWPDTAFPHLSLIRQADVEAVLAQALADRGVQVERGTELIDVHDGPEDVRAVMRSQAETGREAFSYVVGCDGPASTVRARAGIGWPGAPYPVEVVVADAELDLGMAGSAAAHVVAGRRGLVFAFPLGERATWRLLATRPAGPGRARFGELGPAVSAREMQGLLDESGLGARITVLAWSARVSIQRRVAESFSRGRLYLAGDAAHAYSPATGQGMNAAIQDAANLGWKLAFASSRQASRALLDSYDAERRPVARQVLAMTRLAFWFEASVSPLASALRHLAPVGASLMPRLASRHVIAAGARRMSQLGVSYRDSPLAVNYPPQPRRGPRAGDRLPDQTVTTDGRSMRLHELLARPGVHVLLERDAHPLQAGPIGPLVHVHRLSSVPGQGMTAIRPDGYIGLRCQVADARRLDAWLARIGADGA